MKYNITKNITGGTVIVITLLINKDIGLRRLRRQLYGFCYWEVDVVPELAQREGDKTWKN